MTDEPLRNGLVTELIARFDADADARWSRLEAWLQDRFQRELTLEAILFLIGIQSRGRGFEPDLERDVKEVMIMEGSYTAFASLGFYERVGMEANGAWIWERVVDPLPELSIEDQETLLKIAVLRYFEEQFESSEEAPWK